MCTCVCCISVGKRAIRLARHCYQKLAALEYVEDDELVEVTPNVIRLRKVFLRESDRRRNTKGSTELVES